MFMGIATEKLLFSKPNFFLFLAFFIIGHLTDVEGAIYDFIYNPVLLC